MLKKLQSIDSFGVGVGLNYNGKRTHKTYIGSVFAILFLAMGLYNMITLGIDLMSFKDPKVVHTRVFQSDPERIDLTSKSFEFQIGLQKYPTYEYIIDQTVYNVQALYYLHRREINANGSAVYNVTRTNLTLVPCHTLDYHIGKKFEGIDTQKTYCIDYSKHQSIFLQGTWESTIYGAIDIKFNRCINSTNSNITCKSKEEIDKHIEGSFFHMVFSDLELDLNDAKNPEKSFRNVHWDELSAKNLRNNFLYLKNVKVNTDIGLLQEKIEYKQLIGFDHAFSTFSHLNLTNGNFFSLRMKIEEKLDIYDRKYVKFYGFLAELVGLLKTYLILIIFIINPLQKFQFYRKFIGDCCTIDKKSFDTLMPLISTLKNSDSKIDTKQANLTKKQDLFHEVHYDNNNPISLQGNSKEYAASEMQDLQCNDDFPGRGGLGVGQQKQSSIHNKNLANKSEELKLNEINFTVDSDENNNTLSNSKNQNVENDEFLVSVPKNISNEESSEIMKDSPDFTKNVLPIKTKSQFSSIKTQDKNGVLNEDDNNDSQLNPIETSKQGNLCQNNLINISNQDSESSYDVRNIQGMKRTKNYSMKLTNLKLMEQSQPTKIAKVLEKIKNNFQPQNLKEVKMSMTEYILSWFIRNPNSEITKKKVLYKAGAVCVSDLLDVKNLLVLRNEIELLKLLIVEKQDIPLFDSVAKQKINIIDKVDQLRK